MNIDKRQDMHIVIILGFSRYLIT